ncbi:MAG: hypothetical protein K2O71_06595, partial [Lachnospiraceae bacterium]|nr:hypothetical protein [Lachnospiraceae bacterium]
GSEYYYYLGSIKPAIQDIHAVASPDITEATNRKIPVKVYASTAPGEKITEILYLTGTARSVTNDRWELSGKDASDGVFTIRKNGKYSIRVTDSLGRMRITHIVIDNFDSSILEMPKVNTMTNRNEYVNGRAIAGSTIHIALPDGTIISEKTADDGNFSILIPMPRTNDLYTIWATKNGVSSLPIETTIRKTGANRPSANPLYPLETEITGKTDQYTTLSARLGSTVYVGYGEKEAYRGSSIYQSWHKIVETDVSIDRKGNFTISLPREVQLGENWILYATDRNGNASRIVNVIVQEESAASSLTEELTEIGNELPGEAKEIE